MTILKVKAELEFNIYISSEVKAEDMKGMKVASKGVLPNLLIDLFGRNMRRDESLKNNLIKILPLETLDKYGGKKFKDILKVIDIQDTTVKGLQIEDPELKAELEQNQTQEAVQK